MAKKIFWTSYSVIDIGAKAVILIPINFGLGLVLITLLAAVLYGDTKK